MSTRRPNSLRFRFCFRGQGDTAVTRSVLQGIAKLEASRVDDYGMEHAAGTLAFEAQYFDLLDEDGDTTVPPGSTLCLPSMHCAPCYCRLLFGTSASRLPAHTASGCCCCCCCCCC